MARRTSAKPSNSRYTGEPNEPSPEDERELERLLRMIRGRGSAADWASVVGKQGG